MLCHVDSSRAMWGTSHWKLIKLSFIYLFYGLGSFCTADIISLPSGVHYYCECGVTVGSIVLNGLGLFGCLYFQTKAEQVRGRGGFFSPQGSR